MSIDGNIISSLSEKVSVLFSDSITQTEPHSDNTQVFFDLMAQLIEAKAGFQRQLLALQTSKLNREATSCNRLPKVKIATVAAVILNNKLSCANVHVLYLHENGSLLLLGSVQLPTGHGNFECHTNYQAPVRGFALLIGDLEATSKAIYKHAGHTGFFKHEFLPPPVLTTA